MILFYRKRPHSTLPLLIAAFIALLAGCASIPEEVYTTEPSSHLEVTPQVYIRLSGKALRDITSGIDEEEMRTIAAAIARNGGAASGSADNRPLDTKAATNMDTPMLENFFYRTRTFGAGIRGIGTAAPTMEAVFIGDFPVISVRLAMAVDANWRRMGDGGYRSVNYPIFIRPLQPGVLHAATSVPPPYAGYVDIEAYPKRAADLAQSDIFISANYPSAFFVGSLPMEAASIPIGAIVVTGHFADNTGMSAYQVSRNGADGTPKGPEPRYLIDIHMMMKDEATAKAYRPVVKFLWTAAAGKLFKGSVDLSASPLTLEKDVYMVRNIEMDAATLRTLLVTSLLAQ
ncbi:MAG TPA: hypothetical protein VN445_09675 [Rectinemataceae bacterium]|nr:hypothetical protein [Rectinemataceae bacterium]